MNTTCKSASTDSKKKIVYQEFYKQFSEDQRITAINEKLVLRASRFGLKVNNGCYDSKEGIFNEKDLDPKLVGWLKDYSTGYFCEKQRSRFSYFQQLQFHGLYTKQQEDKDYFLYVFKGSHSNEDESSKVVVVLNQQDQLWAVDTSLWE